MHAPTPADSGPALCAFVAQGHTVAVWSAWTPFSWQPARLDFEHLTFSSNFSLTREMQGIVGQASDFMEVVSKIDWTLLQEIWWCDEERSKKSNAIDEQRCGTFFCMNTSAHARVWLSYEFDCRTSSGWRCLWGTHVGGRARSHYRVGPGLRLPMRKKENVEERLKQLQSFAASTKLECERQE